MIILYILALIDIHTLFVWVFYPLLPSHYVFTGATFSIVKGLIFMIPSKNLFSLLDIIVGLLVMLLFFTDMFLIVWWLVFLFLTYKIAMSFIFIF